MLQAFRPGLELEMIEGFKQDAPTLAQGPVPDSNDRLGWLYLMQHFRAPTRLLDWTQSALIGLYFVVSDELKVDGELWALDPQALNRAGEIGPHLPIVETNPVLKYLVSEPYWGGSSDALAREFRMDRPPKCPAAFPPKRNFQRMIAQESTFTIHPRPTTGFTITDLLSDQRALVRYVIPADRKRHLHLALRSLGVNDRTVFPDFEGLSKHVIADSWTLAYSPPDPPTCDGPVDPQAAA